MIVKAADPEEYTEIYDMVDKAFKSKLESTIIKITTSEDPNFQKGDLRVVKVGGKIVSMMMLMRRPLRIGTTIVDGAIIAPVATHPSYQRKGYCSAVMRDAIQYMKNQGFDITILWGNPWLYPHYGYSPAMLKTELVLKAKQNDSIIKSTCESRSFVEADCEQITQIYHSNTATRTCAEIRSPTIWEWRPRNASETKLEVITNRKGEVIGYYSLGTDWGRPCAHEVGVLNDEACGIILNNLIKTANKKGLKEFYCIIHPDHPFARFAFGHDSEIRIRNGGGAGMVKILNLVSLFTRMEKEFERRLHYSELYDLECNLKISSEETVILDINHGEVSIDTNNAKGDYQLDIPLMFLNPLITGYNDISELVKRPQVKLSSGKHVIRLIDVLFPIGLPSGGFLPLTWE